VQQQFTSVTTATITATTKVSGVAEDKVVRGQVTPAYRGRDHLNDLLNHIGQIWLQDIRPTQGTTGKQAKREVRQRRGPMHSKK